MVAPWGAGGAGILQDALGAEEAIGAPPPQAVGVPILKGVTVPTDIARTGGTHEKKPARGGWR